MSMTQEIDQLQLETNLIKVVKDCYPEIYSKNNKNYKNHVHDKMSWVGVSEKLLISTTRCCNNWYSMLQMFLHFARLESKGITMPEEALTWPHMKVFKELQPQLMPKYTDILTFKSSGKSHTRTKHLHLDRMFAEIELHKDELMNASLSYIRRQQIWSNIAYILNTWTTLTALPVFHWQKVWWDVKRRARIRKQLEMHGVKVNCGRHSLDQDLRILEICGISPTENNQKRIKEKLQSCVEIDGDEDHNACEQCSSLKVDEFACEKCSNAVGAPICDICSKNRSSVCCNISNWSSAAMRMIPSSCQGKKKILTCKACHFALNRRALFEWKVCRFCAQENTNLENLMSSAYQQVREIFYTATKIKLSLEDDLPSFICLTCKDQLEGFGKLFTNFVAAQTTLRDKCARLFIGETTSRKRTSTSEDLSNLAESNGVTVSKQARVRSRASSTTTSAASEVNNLNAAATNSRSLNIANVSNAVPGNVAAAERDHRSSLGNLTSAQQRLAQDPLTAGQFVRYIAQANPNTSQFTCNAAQPNFAPVTTVGQFVITEVSDPNQTSSSVAPGFANLNRPSTSSNLQTAMVSTPTPQISGARSSRNSSQRDQPRTSNSTRRTAQKPSTPSGVALNDRILQSVLRQAFNNEQTTNSIQPTAVQHQAPRPAYSLLNELLNRPAIRINAPFGPMHTTQQAVRKPPQRRMTIHSLSQSEATQISLQQVVQTPSSEQPQVETGTPTAPWPLILKKGTRKPPQRRLTIHNLALPSPTDSAGENRSTTPPTVVQMRLTPSSSQNRAKSYFVPLKSGDSPAHAPSRTQAPKTPPPKKTKTPKKTTTPKETTTPKTPPARRMTIHHLSPPNWATHDSPQMQMRPATLSQTEAAAAFLKIDTPSPRAAPIRQRRQTVHYHSLTPNSCELRQSPPRVIETIVIRDDTPPPTEAPQPISSSSQRARKKPPTRREALSSSTGRQLTRTPPPEVIVICDDSPPRVPHKSVGYAPNAPLLRTEIALHASLMIDDDEPISSQDDLDLEESGLELLTPSALINYTIDKAYNVKTPRPPVPESMSRASFQTTTRSEDNRRQLRSASKTNKPKTYPNHFRKAN